MIVNSFENPNRFDGETQVASVPDGITRVGEKEFMADAKGSLVPLALVKPQDKLMDEVVRKIIAFASAESERIARFKGHTFDDIFSFQALLAQEYGTTVGSARGNVTLTSFDGLMRVMVRKADLIEFGPELQAAKALVDECLSEWTEGSRDELRALVNRAFSVDQAGKINRADIFMLRRVQIEDERWKRAMLAVSESIRVIGSKSYILFHTRESVDHDWEAISIDLAKAGGV